MNEIELLLFERFLDVQNGERNMLQKFMVHPVNETNNNEMMEQFLRLNQIQIQIKFPGLLVFEQFVKDNNNIELLSFSLFFFVYIDFRLLHIFCLQNFNLFLFFFFFFSLCHVRVYYHHHHHRMHSQKYILMKTNLEKVFLRALKAFCCLI